MRRQSEGGRVRDVVPAAVRLDSAELGRTLAHEHVFVLGTEYQQNYQDWDEETRVAEAVTALAELKSTGRRYL